MQKLWTLGNREWSRRHRKWVYKIGSDSTCSLQYSNLSSTTTWSQQNSPQQSHHNCQPQAKVSVQLQHQHEKSERPLPWSKKEIVSLVPSTREILPTAAYLSWGSILFSVVKATLESPMSITSSVRLSILFVSKI